MITGILLLTSLILCTYCVLIFKWNTAWNKIPVFNPGEKYATIKLSVIIAVRNEAYVIVNLLNSLLQQDYPKDLYEIIISDDHSSDNTINIAKDFFLKHQVDNGIVIQAKPGESSSKKEAIKRAIDIAKGELIITTDADCIHASEWLKSIASYFNLYKPAMISGSVIMKGDNSFMQQFQTFDYLSLQASGAASLFLNKPLLCSGANLAFTKNAFYDVNDFEANLNIASGDDTFLMMKMHKKFPGKIHFLKSEQSIVITNVSPTIKDFLHQRTRWISKTKHYDNNYIKAIGGFIFLVNVFPFVLLLVGICDANLFYLLPVYLMVKIIADYFFLSNAGKFFNVSVNKIRFAAFGIAYPFYLLALLAGVLRGSYQWKQRHHRT